MPFSLAALFVVSAPALLWCAFVIPWRELQRFFPFGLAMGLVAFAIVSAPRARPPA